METLRRRLSDGAETTVHVAHHDLASTRMRVVRLRRPVPLAAWCAATGTDEALGGGFYVPDTFAPLGELRIRGFVRDHEPFTAPWGAVRACLHVQRGRVAIARRDELPRAPRGDLLQAGPLLVAGGRAVHRDGEDPEGFSAAAEQFDSDITATRHPRAALAIAGRRLVAVATDGRAPEEAGLTLGELADLLVELGADAALNLDGGGSASLVSEGRLRNAPREPDGRPIPGGRPISTALVFRERVVARAPALSRAVALRRAA